MVLEKILDGTVDLNGYIMMFPIIIIVYIISSSFMMQDMGGLIYIFGILLTLLNVYAMSSMSNSTKATLKNYKSGDWTKSGFCYIGLPLINQKYNNVSPNAAIIIFTLFFFLMGDIANNIREMKNPFGFSYFLFLNKPWLIVFFCGMFALNVLAERMYRCNYYEGLDYFVGGGAVGLFSGLLIMVFFLAVGMKNNLQTNSFLQNASSCVVPSKKMFQCDNVSLDDDRVYFLRTDELKESPYCDSIIPGDVDTYNISTLKNYGTYDKIIITGKTMVYFYEKENRKGRVVIIDKYGKMKGKGDFETSETDQTETRQISWAALITKFTTDWPAMKNTFEGPQSILIHKEY